MEELFFAALIGTVHIDSVIPYILRMDQTEYNGQFGNAHVEFPEPGFFYSGFLYSFAQYS